MISGCAARSASWAASWLPEAIASSTLRTKVLIRERRALLVAVRRSVWRTRFFDCGVLAMPAPLLWGWLESAQIEHPRRSVNGSCLRQSCARPARQQRATGAAPRIGATLALAARAVKGRAPGLRHPLHDAAAGWARAWRPFLAIDTEFVLEIAEIAICMPVIAKGRAASRNCVGQSRADLCGQRLDSLFGDPARLPCRVNARPVQGFADIDIAQPRHDPLIQKGRLDGGFPIRKSGAESIRMEGISQRLRPKPRQMRVAGKRICRPEIHRTETARIIVGDRRPKIRRHDEMIMFSGHQPALGPPAIIALCSGCSPCPCLLLPRFTPTWVRDQQAPGHAEMNHPAHAVIKGEQQPFGSSAKRFDPAPRQPLGKALRQLPAEIRAPLFDMDKPPAGKRGLETTTHRFDFWQFRHGELRARRIVRPPFSGAVLAIQWVMHWSTARAKLPGGRSSPSIRCCGLGPVRNGRAAIVKKQLS